MKKAIYSLVVSIVLVTSTALAGYVRKTNSNVRITINLDRLSSKMADLVESQGITTQSQLNAAVDTATQAQINAFTKALIKSVVSINGAGPSDP